jgi:lipid-A-disaccharide synthase
MSAEYALDLQIYQDRSHDVLAAADAALLTSGTVTLEAMLHKLPMVVAYRMNRLSYSIISAMVHVKFAALPNLLAGRRIVPEYLQDDCIPEQMGREILSLLDDAAQRRKLRDEFAALHETLRRDAGTRAAAAVLGMLQ